MDTVITQENVAETEQLNEYDIDALLDYELAILEKVNGAGVEYEVPV